MAKPIVTKKDTFDQWRLKVNQVSENIGDIDFLNTTDKSSLVAGINENKTNLDNSISNIGNLADLDTTDKSSVVAAINEINTDITTESPRISGEFSTEVSRLYGEIDANTSDIDDINTTIGPLASLTTDDKTSVVNSINEITRRLLVNYDVSEVSFDFLVSGDVLDVFLYDTSQDTDRGLWRFQTQTLNWYNETLNTVSRGMTKEFPAVALIVTRDNANSAVTIYDATDTDFPMWMNFPRGSIFASTTKMTGSMLNGVLCVGNYGEGLIKIDFLKEISIKIMDDGYYKPIDELIANRYTTSWSVVNYEPTYDLVSNNINDVALTYLKDSVPDPITGLHPVVIGVSTDSGVTLFDGPAGIGTAVDITGGSSNNVGFTTDKRLMFTVAPVSSPDDVFKIGEIPSVDIDQSSFGTFYTISSIIKTSNITPGNSGFNNDVIFFKNDIIAGAHYIDANYQNPALVFIKEDQNPDLGMNCFIDYTYNTGWMVGDIRGCYLADTVEEILTSPGVEKDRTYKGNNLTATGSISKTPIYPGSDLVKYSGFSPSDYLELNDADFSGVLYVYGWQYNGVVWEFKSGLATTNPIEGVTITSSTLKIAGSYPKALIRVTATGPQQTQLQHIELTESKLFLPDAKCTIQGTGGHITSLSYDRITDILSCATSDGVTEFQDLVAINHLHDNISIKKVSTINKKKATLKTSGAHIYLPKSSLLEKFNEMSSALAIEDTKEDYLGLPSADGMVLSSLGSGERMWIGAPSSSDVTTLTDAVTALQGEISAKNSDILNLSNDIATYPSNINTVSARVPYQIDKMQSFGAIANGGSVSIDATLYDSFIWNCPSGSMTVYITNFPVGRTIHLLFSNGGNCSITWSGLTIWWPRAVIPSWTAASGYDRVVFYKVNSTDIQAAVAGMDFGPIA